VQSIEKRSNRSISLSGRATAAGLLLWAMLGQTDRRPTDAQTLHASYAGSANKLSDYTVEHYFLLHLNSAIFLCRKFAAF